VLQKEIEIVDGDVGISQHLDNVGLRVWKYENDEHFCISGLLISTDKPETCWCLGVYLDRY